jgi:hypothetical protein
VVLQNFGIPSEAKEIVAMHYPFDWDNTSEVLLDTEKKLNELAFPIKVQKQLINIITEALDNVCRHGLKSDENKLSSFSCRILDGVVYMATRNLISSTEIKFLVDMIEQINNSNEEEITKSYKSQLKNGKLDNKGNAGLGFFQMARKSTEPIRYNFSSNDIDNAFFTYLISVDTNKS